MDRGDGLFFSVQAPILPAIDDLTGPRVAGENRLPQIPIERLIVLARPEQAGGLANGLLRRVAGQSGEGRIDRRNPTLAVCDHDGVRGRLHRRILQAKPLLLLALLVAEPRLFQCLCHRLPQACQSVFQQVVGCTLLDALRRRFIPYGSGDDDERNIQPAFLQVAQRPQRVDARQVVIGENDVGRRIEVGEVLRFGLDVLPVRLEPGSAKLVQHELRVIRSVFKTQHAQGNGHKDLLFGGLLGPEVSEIIPDFIARCLDFDLPG